MVDIINLQGEDYEWITVKLESPNPSKDDWVAVFSPANFKYAIVYICMCVCIIMFV